MLLSDVAPKLLSSGHATLRRLYAAMLLCCENQLQRRCYAATLRFCEAARYVAA